MIREISAGIIIYRRHPQEGLQYLVLYHRGNYWNFPKGKLEEGEDDITAAKREIHEETGIAPDKFKIMDGWRQKTNFFFKENRGGKMMLIKKHFVMFLAETSPDTVVQLSPEHNGYAWLEYKMAVKYLRFKNLKAIMAEAHSLIGGE